jgi:hypothetical protein
MFVGSLTEYEATLSLDVLWFRNICLIDGYLTFKPARSNVKIRSNDVFDILVFRDWLRLMLGLFCDKL